MRLHDRKVLWRLTTHPEQRGKPTDVTGPVYDTTDVVALRAADGGVVWRFNSPAAVKASPSFHDGRVFVADYEGTMFALDATTGNPRRHHEVGGPIPGTATVIGHTVYTSSFEADVTVGLDVRDGSRTFEIEQAGYTPVISDGERLYLVAYFDLIGLESKRR